MSADEFRRHGRAVIDWIADYLESVESRPVLSRAAPGSVRDALPAFAPERHEPFEEVLADLERVIMPGITHWQAPGFFAFFPANTSYPAILGELLSAGLGVQGMLWTTSPACTELEMHMMDWLVHLLGLPERFLFGEPGEGRQGGGVIQDTASSAALCALVAARERCIQRGAGRLAVYASTQAHSSIEKAVRIAGLGAESLRSIPTDASLAMDSTALAEAIGRDRSRGITPCLIVATAGTTSTLAFDPVEHMGTIARDCGAWLHVDAAMAGSAAVCPEFRFVNAGLDSADSYCFNPHKWLLVNFDCDCFWVADRNALLRSLSIMPEYLRNQATDAGAVVDYRDWQIPLGRRFRALKIWLTIRHYGQIGLQAHIRRHVELARRFAEQVKLDDRFEFAAAPQLNLVCLRLAKGDEFTQALLDAVNASGRAYVTHTRIDGRLAIRVAIGSTRTEARHVDELWRQMKEQADRLMAC